MTVLTVCQRAGCVPLECQRAVFCVFCVSVRSVCVFCVSVQCVCLLLQWAVTFAFATTLSFSSASTSRSCLPFALPFATVTLALICLCNLSAICVTVTLAVALDFATTLSFACATCLPLASLSLLLCLLPLRLRSHLSVQPVCHLCDCHSCCGLPLGLRSHLRVQPVCHLCHCHSCCGYCLTDCALICLCNLCLPFQRGPCLRLRLRSHLLVQSVLAFPSWSLSFVCFVCHLSGRCVPCVICLSLSCKHFGEHRCNGENLGGNKQNLFPLILSPKAQITNCHQSQSQRPQSPNTSHHPNHQPQTHNES